MDQGCSPGAPASTGSGPCRPGSGSGNPAQGSGIGAPEQVDRVVHLHARMRGEQGVRDPRRELDPDDRLEVLPALARPADVQRRPGPPLPGPEALDRDRVVPRQLPPEPGPEGGPGGVVVHDERDAAPPYNAAELGEPRVAPGPEEVRPAGVRDVDGGIRDRQALRGPGADLDIRQARGPAPSQLDEGRGRVAAPPPGPRPPATPAGGP